jgi:hypothetical protein
MEMEIQNEPVLEDNYPVYASYWYVADGKPCRSDIQGTIGQLKRVWKVSEIRRCNVVARKLPLSF